MGSLRVKDGAIMWESFVFVTGLLIGSFLNVCIYRLPRGESIVSPGSHCPTCHQRLKPWELIPLLSYFFNHRVCRYCGEKISFQYPVIEFLTGVVYLLIYWRFGLSPRSFLLAIFSSALIVIALIDARHRQIPDLITLPGLVIGLLGALFFQQTTFLDALLGVTVGGGLFFLIAVISRGGMGGGDIKLIAFVGSFLGLSGTLLTIFLGSLFGSLFGIYLIIFQRAHRKTMIAYGPFLAMAAFLTALYADELVKQYLHWVLR